MDLLGTKLHEVELERLYNLLENSLECVRLSDFAQFFRPPSSSSTGSGVSLSLSLSRGGPRGKTCRERRAGVSVSLFSRENHAMVRFVMRRTEPSPRSFCSGGALRTTPRTFVSLGNERSPKAKVSRERERMAFLLSSKKRPGAVFTKRRARPKLALWGSSFFFLLPIAKWGARVLCRSAHSATDQHHHDCGALAGRAARRVRWDGPAGDGLRHRLEPRALQREIPEPSRRRDARRRRPRRRVLQPRPTRVALLDLGRAVRETRRALGRKRRRADREPPRRHLDTSFHARARFFLSLSLSLSEQQEFWSQEEEYGA